jgi:hypothetical protein
MSVIIRISELALVSLLGSAAVSQQTRNTDTVAASSSFIRSVGSHRFGAFLLFAGSAGAQSASSKTGSPGDQQLRELQELQQYRLSMDVIERFMRAAKNVTGDPAAMKCVGRSFNETNSMLDSGEKTIKACPAALNALNAGGIKPREFLLVAAKLMMDLFSTGLTEMAGAKNDPAIAREVVAYLDKNHDKITTMIMSLTRGGN